MATQTEILPPRYRGAQLIGRGGMGEIYRATDSTLGRAVAIKVLAERYAQDEAVRTRFTREALAAARLSGEPHTVTIFDVGEWNGRPFIVMEYLSGGSLENRVRSEGAQPAGRALAWLEQAAIALDAAHRNGIVHRDVKPANLLLDRNEDVHVADFGIASAAGLDSLTMTGTILGTAGYLAPEQAQGDRTTPASDRYALGVVAFELLTGTRPFQRETVTAEAMAHVQAEVPSVCDRLAELPCELDPVFRRALAKDPAERYPSCAEFVGALREAYADAAGETRALAPVVAAPPADTAAATRPVGVARGAGPRRAWPIALIVLALAALAGVGLAAALTRDDGTAEAVTVMTTVVETAVRTTEGRTVVVTETETTATTVPADEAENEGENGGGDDGDEDGSGGGNSGRGGGGSVEEGIRLTDQATALMRAGNYAAALPVAQRALGMLEGSGHVYEAYANFDVGNSLAQLGRCEEALPYLERREQLAGPHRDVTRAKAKCGAAAAREPAAGAKKKPKATRRPATPVARPGSVSQGIALTDQSTGLIQQGDYGRALPIAQQALAMLAGSGHTYEGYANYNVGTSLAHLGRCAQAIPYLQRRERLLGPHSAVTADLRRCGAR